MQKGWLAHKYSTFIRESQLDSFGHLTNIQYIQIFEDARWQMLTDHGYGFEIMHQRKTGPVIIKQEIDYRKEVGLRQRVQVETTLISYERKIFKIGQVMKNDSGQVVCRATCTAALFDTVERKIIVPTSDWLRAWGKIEISSESFILSERF